MMILIWGILFIFTIALLVMVIGLTLSAWNDFQRERMERRAFAARNSAREFNARFDAIDEGLKRCERELRKRPSIDEAAA